MPRMPTAATTAQAWDKARLRRRLGGGEGMLAWMRRLRPAHQRPRHPAAEVAG